MTAFRPAEFFIHFFVRIFSSADFRPDIFLSGHFSFMRCFIRHFFERIFSVHAFFLVFWRLSIFRFIFSSMNILVCNIFRPAIFTSVNFFIHTNFFVYAL